jgi:acyl-coenzyme A thioesterase PaaI-like protein
MTDISRAAHVVPGRLGVSAHLDGDALRLELTPRPEVLHHGVVRASVLAYVIDAVAGISVDTDPDHWTLTTDLSVRMRPVPAPALVAATSTIVRRGRRSVTSTVELTDGEGGLVAAGAIGFATVPRRPDDPPKPGVTPAVAARIFDGSPSLSRPLREEAGIEVLDAAEGVAQLEVTADLRNPAGTLQGAMVALLAEAAAEDLVATRFESPVVVTDLDLRYLAQAPNGPVRTRARLLGTGPDAPVQVELTDTSADRLTTLAFARTQLVG